MTVIGEEPAGIAQANPLAGCHAVVTGGGRGIGTVVAETLARLGADVTVMGRTQAVLERRAATLAEACAVRAAAEVDVSEPAAVEAAFASASARLGPPAILVNNAGIALSAPFLRTDLELWNKIFAEVADAVAWLCLPSSASVTGQSILVAGGELM